MSATTVIGRPPRIVPDFSGSPPIPPRIERELLLLRGRLPALGVGLSTLAAASLAWVLAFWLRFDGSLPRATARAMLQALPLVVLMKGIVLWIGGIFRIVWAYVGIADLFAILRASLIILGSSYGILGAFVPERLAPRSIPMLDALLTFLGTASVFVVFRAFREFRRSAAGGAPTPARAVIVGAGDAGDLLLRELQWKFGRTHPVIGFVDDAREKQGARLRGVPVLGPTRDLAALARRHDIGEVLVAIPSAGGELVRTITKAVARRGIRVQVLPAVGQLLGRSALLPQLRSVSIEDLLRRRAVLEETSKIAEMLRGRRILVTGAAGSIGSQLCRQILAHDPGRLVVFDWAETPLHDLLLDLGSGSAGEGLVVSEMGDVTDGVRLRRIFADHEPEIVFHAAALKHVPMCESHAREAIRVNVGGTKLLAELSRAAGVRQFVLISTDKAVHPKSVMGATKRVAEILLRRLSVAQSPTRFIAVRFGNVLGSNGSVIPLFRRQLAEGGPLTVTHPEMRRYFMAIPEAVNLVLHAACLGKGGDLFELDMGDPVRIVDLAEDLIRLSGLVPGKDVRIEFTGVRPGEKLFEELYFSAEKVVPTPHPRIFCLRSDASADQDSAVRLCLSQLDSVLQDRDPALEGIREDLRGILAMGEREGSLA